MQRKFIAILALAPSLSAMAALPALTAANNFGIVGTQSCQVKIGADSFVISEIGPDCQVHIKAPPVLVGAVEAVEVEYRATGIKRSGGQLYYGSMPKYFSDARKWKLPPLVADGKWHVQRMEAAKDITSRDNWLSFGTVQCFRYDPVDLPGGEIEVKALRFVGKDPQKTIIKADPKLVQQLDADPWPNVTPELWGQRADLLPPDGSVKPVYVTCRGGSAFPAQASGGEKVRLSFDFFGERPALPQSGQITFISNNNEIDIADVVIPAGSIKRFSEKLWRLSFDYRLPWCSVSRVGALRLRMTGLTVVDGEIPEAPIDYRRAKCVPGCERPHPAKVVNVAGMPTFAVDGKPIFTLWGGVQSRNRPDQMRHHSDAPLNIVTVYNDVSSWWPHEGAFEPDCFDRAAESYLRENPDAYFMWDLSIYPPSDWGANHPDEMCRDQQGDIVRDGRLSFSLSSTLALDAMQEAMEKAISYLEAAPYANRIIGYRINSGHTIEWLGWDPVRGKKTTLDFSPAAAKAFAKWAPSHYPTLADFTIPKLDARSVTAEQELVWNPNEHLGVVAYHDFLSTSTADDVIRLCRRAREMLGKDKLIGTYFGYVMTLWANGSQQIRSHYSLKHLLDAKAVDYLMSPQPYGIRNLGDMVGEMKPFRTIADAGVVPILEDDTRTHNSVYEEQSNNYQTLTAAQTLGIVRRNLGVSLCRNEPIYMYALCQGSEFDTPAFANDVNALKAASEHALTNGGARRNAEIAYVVSEETIKAMPMLTGGGMCGSVGERHQSYLRDGKVKTSDNGARVLCSNLFQENYKRLGRLGAPVDYVLAENLKDRIGDYKLYIFANAYKVDKGFTQAIADIRKRGAAIVWMGAAGYMTDGENSTDSMSALTGFSLEKLGERQTPCAIMTDGRKMGFLSNAVKIAPLFAVRNADEALGNYLAGGTAIGLRQRENGFEVYCGVDKLDIKLLKDLSARAKVHVFSDTNDPLEANDRFVVLHARFAGKKTIRLPRKTNVYDVFERKLVARDVEEFSFDAPLHTSHLFYYGDDATALPTW